MIYCYEPIWGEDTLLLFTGPQIVHVGRFPQRGMFALSITVWNEGCQNSIRSPHALALRATPYPWRPYAQGNARPHCSAPSRTVTPNRSITLPAQPADHVRTSVGWTSARRYTCHLHFLSILQNLYSMMNEKMQSFNVISNSRKKLKNIERLMMIVLLGWALPHQNSFDDTAYF